jgi:hypothetical protein
VQAGDKGKELVDPCVAMVEVEELLNNQYSISDERIKKSGT